ncbi:MAG: thioesterase, partial [Deltaproteobacteria bacterium]
MDPKIREAMQRQVAREPFAKKLGLKLIEVGEGYALVEM